MPIIEWNEKYSTGLPEIDHQHQILISLINTLDTFRGSDDKPALEQILDTLVEYTKSHFSNEEIMLKNIKYPGFSEHQKQHLKFISQIEQFKDKFRKNADNLGDDLLDFLSDWLQAHILHDDFAYVDFRKKNSIKS